MRVKKEENGSSEGGEDAASRDQILPPSCRTGTWTVWHSSALLGRDLKTSLWGRSENTAGGAHTLRADLTFIPGVPPGPLNPPGVIHELQSQEPAWVWPQTKK